MPFRYVATAIEHELEAVTDNPLVFPAPSEVPGAGDVLAGGNFHGQPLALPLDHLALALCELASFSAQPSPPAVPELRRPAAVPLPGAWSSARG